MKHGQLKTRDGLKILAFIVLLAVMVLVVIISGISPRY
jgi:hypothetical protein